MKRYGGVEEVLKATIQRELYELHAGPCEVVVRERQKDGRAEVRCTAPAGARCIAWNVENSRLFPFLKSHEAADGAFLIERPDGAFDAHILECKLTINQESRGKAKRQMRWTLVRLHALAGALGLRLERAVLYTAYCHDQLSKDPGLFKLPLGQVEALTKTEEDVQAVEALEGQFDWPEVELELHDFEGRFPHRVVRLAAGANASDAAAGRCALDPP